MEHIEKKEVNASNDKKTMWRYNDWKERPLIVYNNRMKIFSEYVNEKMGVLTVGDIIWINISEEDVSIFLTL